MMPPRIPTAHKAWKGLISPGHRFVAAPTGQRYLHPQSGIASSHFNPVSQKAGISSSQTVSDSNWDCIASRRSSDTEAKKPRRGRPLGAKDAKPRKRKQLTHGDDTASKRLVRVHQAIF